MAVQVLEVALQKKPTAASHPAAVRAVGSQATPAMVPDAMHVPEAVMVAPTQLSPVPHGAAREQLAPAAPRVMHDMAMPIEPGVVVQLWPRAQVPPLVQSPPVATGWPHTPQAELLLFVQ